MSDPSHMNIIMQYPSKAAAKRAFEEMKRDPAKALLNVMFRANGFRPMRKPSQLVAPGEWLDRAKTRPTDSLSRFWR